MPALSFSVFKDKILSGAKRQTIRSVRKHPIKEGDVLYMYWKQRSPKEKEKLGESKCLKTSDIEIYKDEVFVKDSNSPIGYQEIKDPFELKLFAIADGFDNWDEMRNFFDKTHGLPFTGVLIKWDSIKTPF